MYDDFMQSSGNSASSTKKSLLLNLSHHWVIIRVLPKYFSFKCKRIIIIRGILVSELKTPQIIHPAILLVASLLIKMVRCVYNSCNCIRNSEPVLDSYRTTFESISNISLCEYSQLDTSRLTTALKWCFCGLCYMLAPAGTLLCHNKKTGCCLLRTIVMWGST